MKEKSMAEKTKSLLYFSFQEKEYLKRNRWEKYRVPVFRVARKGKTQEGRLQYFYVPVPEYYIGRNEHRRLRKNTAKEWPAPKLYEYLRAAVEVVRPDDYYVHPGIRDLLGSKEDGAPPLVLMEAMMSERLRSENIDILLPAERYHGVTDVLLHLLKPYLPRINSIAIIGGEAFFEELEEYFYEEYGIIVVQARRPQKDSAVIDFWPGEREAVNFLDTIVKNGYNTKVN